MTNYAEQAVNDRIESLAWKKAEKRAKMASEREGKVQVGLKWVDGVVNKGVHKTPEDYIDVCREDAREELEAEAELEIEKMNQEFAQQKALKSGGRYIERLEVAERDGLNHGKPWICRELDVETKGACPSMEGEAVCYVYA